MNGVGPHGEPLTREGVLSGARCDASGVASLSLPMCGEASPDLADKLTIYPYSVYWRQWCVDDMRDETFQNNLCRAYLSEDVALHCRQFPNVRHPAIILTSGCGERGTLIGINAPSTD